MTALVIALLAMGTFAFLLLPIFRPEGSDEAQVTADPKTRYLKEKREQILDNIVDLDGEFQSGKLGQDDYKRLRDEAIGDVLGLEQRIEQQPPPAAVEPVAPPPAAAGSAPAKPLFCGKCGAKNPRSNTYCNDCGAKIAE